ncbi:MAG: hypothetical protein K5930_08735 [Treponemataceae bacterium]|nr:hypothetical protein [Treponemataceae bacterium]
MDLTFCDNLLIPLFEKHLINANCACRVGKGTDYSIKLLRSFMTKHYKKYGNNGYFVKLDIKKFFPSISHEVLYKKLDRFHFENKEKAKKALERIKREVEKDKLSLNPKSAIIKVKNGLEFLGWRFRYSSKGKIIQTVKRQSKQRIFKKLRQNLFLVKINKKTTEDFQMSLSSYKGHLLRGNGWLLLKKIYKFSNSISSCLVRMARM